MTPKEKAKELVDKFIPLCGMEMTEIQCALIAVDEILSLLPLANRDYWQEVKQELENK